jgi:hypothetical protein
MLRKMLVLATVVVLALVVVLPVAADAPNFQAGIWADGRQWGTKGLSALPNRAPAHSFDKLLFFVGVPEGVMQAPVAEAAPGNRDFNGGRWVTHQVTILDATGIQFPLTSYAEVLQEQSEGDLVISAMPVYDGVHPIWFECPLLPYK